MKLQNEYLIIIDEETSSGFYQLCNSSKRFNEFLENSSEIKVQKSKIIFAKRSYNYQLKRGSVKGKNQNYFYINLGFEGDEKDIEKYKELLRKIKSTFHKNDSIIETLRDDLSFHYSQLSYALIHEIENLMRKFITYFMIINVGKNWIDESSPNQIKEALDKSKRKQYMDVLQQLDFIHLGDFLFKSYHEEDISSLFEKIKTIDKDISPNELQAYIPKSNWDKYFKEKVDCDDIYLKKKWEQLYELRNKIAHTSHFTMGNYNDIQDLVSDIKEKLEKAFSTIDKIEIHEDDREHLSQSIATNMNENIGIFLGEWNKLENQITRLSDGNKTNFLQNILVIHEKGYLETALVDIIRENRSFRNNLVHGVEIINPEIIQINIDKIKKINNILQGSWGIEIKDAFIKLGGEATLNQLYITIEENTNRELTASWKSTVRRTIYNYSSDTDIFLDKGDLYKRVGKGKWKLRHNVKTL